MNQIVPRTVAEAKRPLVVKRPCPLPHSFPSTFGGVAAAGRRPPHERRLAERRRSRVGFERSTDFKILKAPPVKTADAVFVTIWTLPAVASTTAPTLIWSGEVSGWFPTVTSPVIGAVFTSWPTTGGGGGAAPAAPRAGRPAAAARAAGS